MTFKNKCCVIIWHYKITPFGNTFFISYVRKTKRLLVIKLIASLLYIYHSLFCLDSQLKIKYYDCSEFRIDFTSFAVSIIIFDAAAISSVAAARFCVLILTPPTTSKSCFVSLRILEIDPNTFS